MGYRGVAMIGDPLFFTLNHTIMISIELSPREYVNFREIFKSKFDAKVHHGLVLITASISSLKELGYI